MTSIKLTWIPSPDQPRTAIPATVPATLEGIADGQRIYRSTDWDAVPTFPVEYQQIADVGPAVSSYIDRGVFSQAVSYAVVAYNDLGESEEIVATRTINSGIEQYITVTGSATGDRPATGGVATDRPAVGSARSDRPASGSAEADRPATSSAAIDRPATGSAATDRPATGDNTQQ